jgi:2-iminoacetate synthase ThiH
MGKSIIKRATQVSGHSLKLHFCMFEKSQGRHNSLDCHKKFKNIFHQLENLHAQRLTQIIFSFAFSKHLNLNNGDFFFQMYFSFIKCAPFLLKIEEDFNIDD